MVDYSWEPSTDTPSPTDYQIDRSIDLGLTWVALVTIPHVIPGADYDTETARFTFTDATPVLGELIRIRAVDSGDSTRDSTNRYVHGAPAIPQTLHIFGTVIDAVTGAVRSGVEVRIRVLDQESSTFVPSAGAPNVPSNLGRPLLGQRCPSTVITDDDGNWSVDVLRDLPLEVNIPQVGFCVQFRVPKDRDLLNIVDAYEYEMPAETGARSPYEYGVGSGYVT